MTPPKEELQAGGRVEPLVKGGKQGEDMEEYGRIIKKMMVTHQHVCDERDDGVRTRATGPVLCTL